MLALDAYNILVQSWKQVDFTMIRMQRGKQEDYEDPADFVPFRRLALMRAGSWPPASCLLALASSARAHSLLLNRRRGRRGCSPPHPRKSPCASTPHREELSTVRCSTSAAVCGPSPCWRTGPRSS